MCALEIQTTWKGGISIQPGMWDSDGVCGRAPPQFAYEFLCQHKKSGWESCSFLLCGAF